MFARGLLSLRRGKPAALETPRKSQGTPAKSLTKASLVPRARVPLKEEPPKVQTKENYQDQLEEHVEQALSQLHALADKVNKTVQSDMTGWGQ